MKMGGFEIRARPEVKVLKQDFDFEASRGHEIINVEVTALTAPIFSAKTVRDFFGKHSKKCVKPETTTTPR